MVGHNIRLILTDIDGTILPYGQRVVSTRVRKAFAAAREAGIQVGPASGRGFSHVPVSFGGDAACSQTCLAGNGMQVYLDGELLHQALLPRETVVRLAELVRDVDRAGLICFEDGLPLLVEGEVADLEKSFEMYARQCKRVDAVPAHDIEKANVFVNGDMAATQKVFDYIRSRIQGLDSNVPMAGFLNFMPAGWNKATGIDLLCEALNIGLDQVVAFGDAGNDVEMLAHVPNSVAVANAVPEAAAAARWHIGPCDDEAVAWAIEELAAGRWPFTA